MRWQCAQQSAVQQDPAGIEFGEHDVLNAHIHHWIALFKQYIFIRTACGADVATDAKNEPVKTGNWL